MLPDRVSGHKARVRRCGLGSQQHNEADLVFSQKQLDDNVTATHTLFHNLFVEAYARTLGQLRSASSN